MATANFKFRRRRAAAGWCFVACVAATTPFAQVRAFPHIVIPRPDKWLFGSGATESTTTAESTRRNSTSNAGGHSDDCACTNSEAGAETCSLPLKCLLMCCEDEGSHHSEAGGRCAFIHGSGSLATHAGTHAGGSVHGVVNESGAKRGLCSLARRARKHAGEDADGTDGGSSSGSAGAKRKQHPRSGKHSHRATGHHDHGNGVGKSLLQISASGTATHGQESDAQRSRRKAPKHLPLHYFGVESLNPKGKTGFIPSACEDNCNYRGTCRVMADDSDPRDKGKTKGVCFCQPSFYGESCGIQQVKKKNNLPVFGFPLSVAMLNALAFLAAFCFAFLSLQYEEHQKVRAERGMGYNI